MLSDEVAKSTNPLISVILATKGNKTEFLGRCIQSLNKQTFQEFEIILVYSIFPESIRSLLDPGKFVTIKENGSTLGAARNLGIQHAKADLIVFIDDDAEAPENWLEKIYSTFQRFPSISCLGGPHLTPLEDAQKSPMVYVQGSFMESVMQSVSQDSSAVGKIAGCNVAYRKRVFNEIGYLNETLKSGEDWEFHMRLVDNGYSLRFDPEISVWHHRQGLKHAFYGSSNVVPIFLSRKTLRFAKHESIFATIYLTNSLFLLLIIILFIAPLAFLLIFGLTLLGHIILTVTRTKTLNRKILYYPLILLFTSVRLAGFYFGVFRQIKSKIH